MLSILVTVALAVPPVDEPDWIDLFLEGSRALEEGELEAARGALERALELQPHHAPTAWQLAGTMARVGDNSGALAQLESAVAWGGGEAALLRWDPDLASLRMESRFGELLEQLRVREAVQPAPEPLVAELAVRGGGVVHSISPRAEVVSSCLGGDTLLRDLRARETLAVFDRPGESVESATISPDGRLVVVTGRRQDGILRRPFLRVFEAVTGDLVTELEGVGGQAKVQFTWDAARMLVAGLRGGIHHCAVWETENWTQVGSSPIGARQAQLSPDGTRILYRDGDHCDVLLWDVDEGRVLERHEDLTASGDSLDFSTDGALALAHRGGTVHVYDASDGAELRRIEAGESPFRDACFLGATGELVTIDDALCWQVWSARTGEWTRSVRASGVGERWCRLEASPDGSRLLVTEFGGPLQVFDTATGELLWATGDSPNSQFSRAHQSPDGSRILVARYDRNCTIHDARSGEVLSTLSDPEPGGIVRAHPRRNELWIGRENGFLDRIDAVHGRVVERWRHGRAKIIDIRFTRSGERVATIDRERVLRVINPKSGEVEALIPNGNPSGPDRGAPRLRFAPDGLALLVTDSPTAVRVYDPIDGSLRCEIEAPERLWQWTWKGDGRLLAAAGKGGRVWLFDAGNGDRLPPTIQICSSIRTIAFEPRGDRLWVGDEASTVHVFEVEAGTEVHTLDLQDLDIFDAVKLGSITFRDDGEVAITASSDIGVVAAWNPRTGRRIWSYSHSGGNGSPLYSAFGSSGDRVYVWGQGPWSPRIVSAEDGSALLDLSGRRFRDLLPLRDEQRLAIWGWDGLEVIETHRGTRRWARYEPAPDEWLLSTSTHHVDGTRRALEQLHLVLPERSFPLDALAAVLLDPKRVRAAAEGIELAALRLPAMPELDWVSQQSRVVTLGDDQEPPTVALVGRCNEGVAGFELLRNGVRQRLIGEEVSPTERRLTLPLERPARGESIDYRWRTIGTTGLLSRALHLTVEVGR